MYDIIHDFIANDLISSTSASPYLANILTDISIVLIFMVLVRLLIWCIDIAKGAFNL